MKLGMGYACRLSEEMHQHLRNASTLMTSKTSVPLDATPPVHMCNEEKEDAKKRHWVPYDTVSG